MLKGKIPQKSGRLGGKKDRKKKKTTTSFLFSHPHAIMSLGGERLGRWAQFVAQLRAGVSFLQRERTEE